MDQSSTNHQKSEKILKSNKKYKKAIVIYSGNGLNTILKHKLLMVYEFLSYFNDNEIIQLGMVNRKFNEIFKIYTSNWLEQIKLLSKKLNFSLENQKIDLTKYKAIKNKTKYPLNDCELNYIYFRLNSISQVSCLIDGAHLDNPSYWYRHKDKTNSLIENINPFHLINVCWLDANIRFLNVQPGKYKVFINHGILNYQTVENNIRLTIICNDFEIFSNRKYMNSQMIKEIKKSRGGNGLALVLTYLTDINVIQIGNKLCNVSLHIEHLYMQWKNGLILDGAILEMIDNNI